jgi:hypothetical protein
LSGEDERRFEIETSLDLGECSFGVFFEPFNRKGLGVRGTEDNDRAFELVSSPEVGTCLFFTSVLSSESFMRAPDINGEVSSCSAGADFVTLGADFRSLLIVGRSIDGTDDVRECAFGLAAASGLSTESLERAVGSSTRRSAGTAGVPRPYESREVFDLSSLRTSAERVDDDDIFEWVAKSSGERGDVGVVDGSSMCRDRRFALVRRRPEMDPPAWAIASLRSRKVWLGVVGGLRCADTCREGGETETSWFTMEPSRDGGETGDTARV